MHYLQIRNQLQTGDMLCWSGSGVFSEAIKAGQQASGFEFWGVSHIGMVVKGLDFGLRSPAHVDRMMTFESTTMNSVADVLSGEFIKGVSVVPLTSKMAGYQGSLFVRRLEAPSETRAYFTGKIMKFIMETHGTPYERKIPQLLASALPMNHGVFGEDGSSLFCSEAYVEAMEYAGALAESGQDSDAMCPAEVADIERHGKIVAPFYFHPPMEIRW